MVRLALCRPFAQHWLGVFVLLLMSSPVFLVTSRPIRAIANGVFESGEHIALLMLRHERSSYVANDNKDRYSIGSTSACGRQVHSDNEMSAASTYCVNFQVGVGDPSLASTIFPIPGPSELACCLALS